MEMRRMNIHQAFGVRSEPATALSELNMPAHTSFLANPSRSIAVLGLAALLTACATPQESASRYDTSRENTQRDAQSHAMAGGPSAASQLQMGFGDTGPTPAQTAQ